MKCMMMAAVAVGVLAAGPALAQSDRDHKDTGHHGDNGGQHGSSGGGGGQHGSPRGQGGGSDHGGQPQFTPHTGGQPQFTPHTGGQPQFTPHAGGQPQFTPHAGGQTQSFSHGGAGPNFPSHESGGHFTSQGQGFSHGQNGGGGAQGFTRGRTGLAQGGGRPNFSTGRQWNGQASGKWNTGQWVEGRRWNSATRRWDDQVAARRGYFRNWVATRRFSLGGYYWPRGYSYRRWVFGETLPFIFFAQDYWLDDFVDYGLPAPPYGCEWVRYGPDAILVDVETGEIIQVVYDIFY